MKDFPHSSRLPGQITPDPHIIRSPFASHLLYLDPFCSFPCLPQAQQVGHLVAKKNYLALLKGSSPLALCSYRAFADKAMVIR